MKKTRKRARVSKITKNSNMAEVIIKYPKVAEVLIDYGLHCVGCALSSFDTIEQGARIHGLSDSDIDDMLERINEVVKYGQ